MSDSHFGSPGDLHSQRVAQEIERLGHMARILDLSSAGHGLNLSLSYKQQLAEFSLQTNASFEPTRLADVRAIWNGRPSPAATHPGIVDSQHRRFACREWQDALEASMVNPLSAQRAAVKPYQLAIASKVAHFVERDAGRLVHKAMTSPSNAFVETRQWQETDRTALDRLPLAPAIFQEVVEGPMDIRATIVGTDISAASISTHQSRARNRLAARPRCTDISI